MGALAHGSVSTRGELGLRLIRGRPAIPAASWAAIRRDALPAVSLPREVNAWRVRNWPNLWRGARTLLPMRAIFGTTCPFGALWLRVWRGDGRIEDLGLASLRVVTDVGVAFIVDAFQNSVELEIMKYHGFGTGGAAEAVGNTALTTELTTQYAGDVRPTGSLAEGASANIFSTVATLSPDSGGTIAITEHGIFSQAATGGGVLLDRSLFSAVNLVAGSDSLQATYQLTLPSGG